MYVCVCDNTPSPRGDFFARLASRLIGSHWFCVAQWLGFFIGAVSQVRANEHAPLLINVNNDDLAIGRRVIDARARFCSDRQCVVAHIISGLVGGDDGGDKKSQTESASTDMMHVVVQTARQVVSI